MRGKQDSSVFKSMLKTALVLGILIVLCRVTKGYATLLFAAMGSCWAFARKPGKALACFSFFSFLIVLDPGVLPKTSVMVLSLRLSPVIIGLLLSLFAISRPGTNRLPFGALFLYLGCACISSVSGWHMGISYLKIVNFTLFLLGIWIGTQNMERSPSDVYFIRRYFLGLMFFLIVGSLITLAFPSIGYSTSLSYSQVDGKAGAALAIAELKANGGVSLFSGLLNHSQALAPTLSCSIALLFADMLFIERRMSYPHIGLLCIAGVELFMTRSRTGLFSCGVGCAMMLLYAPRHLSVMSNIRAKIRHMVSALLVALVIMVVAGEMSSGMFSRWILKTNDTESAIQQVGFKDALTGTRQALIEQSLAEFRMNPLFGMGFQVNYGTAELFGGRGIVFSAPVEKGLLVTTVLGEGGIVGSLAFLTFLVSFYATCIRKRLIVTVSMFTVFLATNVGEATFFSPGGVGGILWVICVVGGFSLDTLVLCERMRSAMIERGSQA